MGESERETEGDSVPIALEVSPGVACGALGR